MELVSVIMSTYNEPIFMLEKSIDSIINQSYKNIEFIIINDNPGRCDLSEYLEVKTKSDSRIVYIKNICNMGLVNSLNTGIKIAKGKYIARMDADDISVPTRIELQMNYIKKNQYDLIGANVKKINYDSKVIGEISVPSSHRKIVALQKYGSCLLHPTWFGIKSVFTDLDGYRNLYACEDYDFVMRAIQNGYKFGNVPKSLLLYRIRKNGISVSSEARQKLLMYYISKNRKHINELTEKDFESYISSDEYKKKEKKINVFIDAKMRFIAKKQCKTFLKLITNGYFYKTLFSKIMLRR